MYGGDRVLYIKVWFVGGNYAVCCGTCTAQVEDAVLCSGAWGFPGHLQVWFYVLMSWCENGGMAEFAFCFLMICCKNISIVELSISFKEKEIHSSKIVDDECSFSYIDTECS